MLPKNRPPTTAGEIILEEFLLPMGMTQVELAKQMDVPLQRLNGILRGKRAVTAETALLLERTLKMSAEFWMACQTEVDLWHAKQQMKPAS
jgi:antitoxin HigA-1